MEIPSPAPSVRAFSPASLIALFAGPVLGLAVRALEPGGLSGPAASVLGVGVWMATWWISECLPLAVTALLPIALFPALGVATTKEAASSFANEVVFLYLGGFWVVVPLATVALVVWPGLLKSTLAPLHDDADAMVKGVTDSALRRVRAEALLAVVVRGPVGSTVILPSTLG